MSLPGLLHSQGTTKAMTVSTTVLVIVLFLGLTLHCIEGEVCGTGNIPLYYKKDRFVCILRAVIEDLVSGWMRCIFVSDLQHSTFSPSRQRSLSQPDFLNIIPNDPVSTLLLPTELYAAPYNRAAGIKHRCITTLNRALTAPRSKTAADSGSVVCSILHLFVNCSKCQREIETLS